MSRNPIRVQTPERFVGLKGIVWRDEESNLHNFPLAGKATRLAERCLARHVGSGAAVVRLAVMYKDERHGMCHDACCATVEFLGAVLQRNMPEFRFG